MLYHRKKITALVFLVLIGAAGCYKNKTVLFDTAPEITRPVSFAADIIPLFNSGCALSGCHVAGAKSPDFSSLNAYVSLSTNNLVNVATPESSVVYLWMTGKKSTPMPVSGINKEFNALILAWIKQGAQNN